MNITIKNLDCDCEEFKELCNKTDEDLKPLKEFSLNGEVVLGRSYYVYDGDTIRVACFFNNELYRYNIRLDGFDTPELRAKTQKEKDAGYMARDWLRGVLDNKLVWLECKETDKYGRLLANVYVIDDKLNVKTTYKDYECVNDRIIKEGYAIAYSGQTKSDWEKLIENRGYPLK